MHLACPPGQQLERGVHDEAERQAVGDGIGERHDQRRQRRGYRFGNVAPVDLQQLAHHQPGNVEQGRGRGVSGHDGGQRRDEQRSEKQHAHGQRREPGAATRLHAGSAFDISRGAAGAEQRAGENGQAVGKQRAPEAALAVLGTVFQQPGLAGDAGERAGGVKNFHQHEHQNDVKKPGMQRAQNVELEQGRRNARRHRHDAVILGQPERHAGQRHRHDADENGAAHPPVIEQRNQQKAAGCQHHRQRGQIAQPHLGGRIRHHDPRVRQRDDRQEHADPCRNGAAQRLRNARHQPRPHAGDGQQNEDAAGDENRPQRLLPGEAHPLDHGEGEKGVQPHARRQSYRPVGDEGHDECAQGRRQTGGDEHGAGVHARGRQNRRVDEDDVRHGEKGRHPRQNLGAHIGAVHIELEQSLQIHEQSPGFNASLRVARSIGPCRIGAGLIRS